MFPTMVLTTVEQLPWGRLSKPTMYWKSSTLGESDSGPSPHFLPFCTEIKCGEQSLQQPLVSPIPESNRCVRQGEHHKIQVLLVSSQVPLPILKLVVQ